MKLHNAKWSPTGGLAMRLIAQAMASCDNGNFVLSNAKFPPGQPSSRVCINVNVAS